MASLPTPRLLDRATPPHIATLILIAGLGALSMNVFLPSLPDMAAYFGTDYGVVQLSVSLYLGVTAAMQLVIGPVSDRFGRRPVLLGAMAVFLLATLGCIYAPTVEVFLAFRMMQAAVATGLVLSRAIVRDMVPQAQAASMIGYVTMGMSVVPMIGPAVGGWLDTQFGWHASFWLLLAVGTLVIALVWTDLGETVSGERRSFRAQFAEYPELFGSPRFWGYVGAAMFASGAFFAYVGGAPFVGSEVFDLSPAELGVYFGAPAVGYFAGNFVSGRFSVSVGIDRMILWGSLLTAAGLACSVALSLSGTHSAVLFFGLMTFVGLGNGMVLPNAQRRHAVGAPTPRGHRLGPRRRVHDRGRGGAGGLGGFAPDARAGGDAAPLPYARLLADVGGRHRLRHPARAAPGARGRARRVIGAA